MNITLANNPEATLIYVGKCKNNTAPKHISGENVATKKITIIDTLSGDKPVKIKVTAYDSPKTAYIYLKSGTDWLWAKNKDVMNNDTYETAKVTRKPNEVPVQQKES